MRLNIKNAETCRLVDELVALTGQSKTVVVTEAVRKGLDEIRKARDQGDPFGAGDGLPDPE